MEKRKYELKKRRDMKELVRINLNVNNVTLENLEIFTKFYNTDISAVLSSLLEEFFLDKKLRSKYLKYFNEIYKKNKEVGVHSSGMFRNYNVPKKYMNEIEKFVKNVDDSKEKISASMFARSLVSFFKKEKFDTKKVRVKEVLDQIRKNVDRKIINYDLCKDGLYVLLDLRKKRDTKGK